MLSSIKNYALAALAVAVGLLAAVASWYRASLKSAQLKGSEEARETESKATDAMVKGLDNEAKIQADTNTDRSKFLD